MIEWAALGRAGSAMPSLRMLAMAFSTARWSESAPRPPSSHTRALCERMGKGRAWGTGGRWGGP